MATPQPRSGLLGSWDRFVGPGMSAGETVLVIGAGIVGGLCVALHLSALDRAWPVMALGVLIGADIIGGAVCNMTGTTKRWYHRPEQRPRDHLGFIALHLLYVVAVAWAFRGAGFDAIFALVVGGFLIVAASMVVYAPAGLRSPLATALYAVALGLSLYGVGPTPGLEWFVPLLFVKLLIGHATPPLRA